MSEAIVTLDATVIAARVATPGGSEAGHRVAALPRRPRKGKKTPGAGKKTPGAAGSAPGATIKKLRRNDRKAPAHPFKAPAHPSKAPAHPSKAPAHPSKAPAHRQWSRDGPSWTERSADRGTKGSGTCEVGATAVGGHASKLARPHPALPRSPSPKTMPARLTPNLRQKLASS